MQDNFLERMNARLTERGIKGRQDLEMHDARTLESGRAVRVLAVYSPLFGPPSTYDVNAWVQARMGEFGSQVYARPDTISVYPEQNFLTFIVEQRTTRQPLEAKTGMIQAGVDQYLDNSNALWEVVKADQGPSYLVRKDGVSVERMLEIRRQALRGGVSGRKNVMLATLDSMPAPAGGYATADVGDVVDFYNAGLIHRGKITSVGKSGVKVKALGRNETFTLDPQAITSIIEKSAGAMKEQDDVMRRYYSLIYPGNPEMTEIISPTSKAKITDPRPLKVEPIEEVAAPMSASARGNPETPAHPTQRVLGKMPGARAAR